MGQLDNCARCNAVFVKSMRDICQKCYYEEEEAFETVYRFLSKRENREATIFEIVEATEVEEELIIKFIREKRLRTSQFPKLAYPCEKCGIQIVSGKLCQNCSDGILQQFKQQEQLEKRAINRQAKEERVHTYYSIDKKRS